MAIVDYDANGGDRLVEGEEHEVEVREACGRVEVEVVLDAELLLRLEELFVEDRVRLDEGGDEVCVLGERREHGELGDVLDEEVYDVDDAAEVEEVGEVGRRRPAR